MPEKREAVIAEIIFYNKGNGYTVAIFETESEQFTAVGALPGAAKGRTYRLTGGWKQHPSYGEQFAFSEFEEILPTTDAGIEEFLASGLLRGIGRKTAAAIVRRFGADTFRILAEEPARLTEVPGIGAAKAASAAEAFRTHREFAEILLYFRPFGVSTNDAMRLYKQYGERTIAVAEENPYQLIHDVEGIGFRRADAMALRLGVSKNDAFRIQSGIEFVLGRYVGEGSTFVPRRELCERTALFLEVSSEEIDDQLVALAFDGSVMLEALEGREVVYLSPYAAAEKNVTLRLIRLFESALKSIRSEIESLIALTEKEKKITLSEQQKNAVRTSLHYGVSVITGGPGTGKTTIINTIVSVLEHGGLKVAIAAPTGRAAKRITETSGYPAQTIHRLLEYSHSEGEERMRFGRTEENPLEYDAVIVDEASMVDLLLMNGLMNAIKPGTRLILVGDADQLPSVGAGNVLRDLLESEAVYAVRLTEIFRQARESLIVVNAHRINHGEYPSVNEKNQDFFLLRQDREVGILQTIISLYKDRLPAYYTECVPIRDIQVLTPVRKGTIGSIRLNQELQEALNPPRKGLAERKYGERVFREGDKVMQIRNNYQLAWKRVSDFSEGEGVFNGDVGFIERIDTEFNRVIVVFDEDKYVTYDATTLDELELAYAVTVHKSQGSEFPIVIMPMAWFPPMLATRNLLYTAVTRGKQGVVLVGSERKLDEMVDNNRTAERYSGLAERLRRADQEGLL